MVEDGEYDPWPLIERTPPEVPGEESDTRTLRVGSNGGALLDKVDELTELVERESDEDVDWERVVLVECESDGAVVWENPEGPGWDTDEEDECKGPEE